MQYLVKFEWGFNPRNTAIFDTKKEAITFAQLMKKEYGNQRDFYCVILEFDLYKPIEF